jgi:hypothetical protein
VNALLLQFVVWTLAGWIQRGQQSRIDYLVEENRVLREQMGKRRVRLTDDQRRRLAMRAKALGRAALRDVAGMVTPDTLLRWYRNLVARKYDGSQSRTTGRPSTAAAIAKLVVRMATENPGWGYTRIRGALYNLGHDIGRNTVKRVLTDAGLEPAPERRRSPSWNTFLKAHWDAIAAVDFFAVEVMTLTGLVRYFVLFVIDMRSRRVQIAGGQPLPVERVDGAGREESHRQRRRLSPRCTVSNSRSRPDVHPAVHRHLEGCGCRDRQASGPKPESQRLRGTLGAHGAARVPAPHCSFWRGAPAPHSA